MPTTETSPVVMVLIGIAAASTLLAWALSARHSRRTRALVAYLKQNRDSYWRTLPWFSRTFNPIGVIEAYRRSCETPDPEFLALYEASKSGNWAQISAIFLAFALIGVVLIGTTFWGWGW